MARIDGPAAQLPVSQKAIQDAAKGGSATPAENPATTWGPKDRKNMPMVLPNQAAQVNEGAQANRAAHAQGAGEVYGNARKALDGLEFQLKGVPVHLRDQLLEAIADGDVPPPQLKGLADKAVQTMNTLHAQLAALPADQAANVEKLLDQDKSWPLTDKLFETISNFVKKVKGL